jgi:hypothetical protein
MLLYPPLRHPSEEMQGEGWLRGLRAPFPPFMVLLFLGDAGGLCTPRVSAARPSQMRNLLQHWRTSARRG